jgi:hypothetical protein
VALWQRSLKVIEFTLDSIAFDCQVQTWNVTNNTQRGEKIYSFCRDGTGETREETVPDYVLDLVFWSDWRSEGISDWLWDNDDETVAFQLDHHPYIVGEHVRWTGECIIIAPTVGGEVKTTEKTTVALPCIGKPVKTRP